MPPSLCGSRLTEKQKQTVICPRCLACIGQPCRGFSRGDFVRLDGKRAILSRAHEERKRMAAMKIARESRRTS